MRGFGIGVGGGLIWLAGGGGREIVKGIEENVVVLLVAWGRRFGIFHSRGLGLEIESYGYPLLL